MYQCIGLTGGIGSGKSTVARIFRSFGIPVYNADLEAARLRDSPLVTQQIIDRWGTEILSNGLLDRRKLAHLVFANPSHLKWLNALIHPLVQADFLAWKIPYGHTPVMMEVAILFEARLDPLFDFIIAVDAPEEVRIQRVMQRDACSRLEVTSRINRQLPAAERNQKAGLLLINDEQQSLLRQIDEFMRRLQPGN